MAEATLENCLLKKSAIDDGRMAHEIPPAAEKPEIIRTVEISPLPVRRTLAQIGIPKSTFYGWLDRHASQWTGGVG